MYCLMYLLPIRETPYVKESLLESCYLATYLRLFSFIIK